MFNQAQVNTEMRDMYFHACNMLENSDYFLTKESKPDRDIWYELMPWGSVYVTEVYEDIDMSLRFEFHEDNHGRVTVSTCHKCNQSGCFYTEPEYEGSFAI